MAARKRMGVDREFADGKMILKRGDKVVEEKSIAYLQADIDGVVAQISRLEAQKEEIEGWKAQAEASISS